MEEKEKNVKKGEDNGLDSAKKVLNKVSKKSKEIAEKVNKEEVKRKEDALVTCRILFISVLDKILIFVLVLSYVMGTYSNFKGNISDLSYGFWSRVGDQFWFTIIMLIVYLFLNWLYKCAAKTMLCVTKEQIYSEKYIPFHRWELSVPLNKVTAINSYKYLWIFRAVVIHQYGKLPKIFWTWNAQEFKDKVEELLTKTDVKVNNQFDTKNIINKNQSLYVIIFAALIVISIAVVGVARLFAYMTSGERNMGGTYVYQGERIVLEKDGTCTLNVSSYDNAKSCYWNYNSDEKVVNVNFVYETSSYWSGVRENNGYLNFSYNDDVLEQGGKEFKKQ